MSPHQLTVLIKNEAQNLGFNHCGIARAKKLTHEEPHLKKWLQNQHHGQMSYMQNHYPKRLDPTLLVEGAKSIISVLINYNPPQTQPSDTLQISRYAYGEDYHHVIKEKLALLNDIINQQCASKNSRYFTDSAPVLDRAWAVQAGLGWIGKNSMLINKTHGSYFFIGEIITDVELEYDSPFQQNYCGSCRRCIDACPTQAIVEPHIIDARKCISYLTIELNDDIPPQFQAKLTNKIFGCDICQEVCPWNRFALTQTIPQFQPHPQLFNLTVNNWNNLTKEQFNQLFHRSAVKRTRFKGLKRNIQFITNTTQP